MMFKEKVAKALLSFRRRWSIFFHKRCLVGFPWFWAARPFGHHAMVEARRIVRRHFGREHSPAHRAIAQVLVAACWPLAALVNLWEARHQLGPYHVPVKRIPGAIWAALRHNILPSEYFAYGLWLPDRLANIDNYLYSKEAARLFKVLNRPSHSNPISDKFEFWKMCKDRDISTPEVLAAFTPTGKLLEFHSGLPPQRDLFVKARFGLGGDGAERFRWDGAMFESNRGHYLGPEHLRDHLAARARMENRTLLVQPGLANHPKLRVSSNGALATARLVTGLSADGEVIPIFCFMMFGESGKITAHSNHVLLIDVANGRAMPPPPPNFPGISIYDYRELRSGETCTLPDWDAALKHVAAAHRACANFVFVGWDVAFTEHGPMVLEGNENWCADTYQTLCGAPLGPAKFAEVLATRLTDQDG